ncbi:hypothetical protein SH139x_001409 [Planctomycetaceae bacterium SH139]
MRFRHAAAMLLCGWMASCCAAQPQAPFGLPPAGEPMLGTLATEATVARRWVLTAGAKRSVAMRPQRPSRAQYWTLAPVGQNTVRLQLFEAGRLWSLAVDRETGRVGIERSDDKFEQLWRVSRSPRAPQAVRLQSVGFRGLFLTGETDSQVSLQPPSGRAAQEWIFDPAPPPPVVNIPVQQMAEHAMRPNPPLPPAATRLVNTHSSELLVRITDLRSGTFVDLAIPAGGSRNFEFQRDSGATFVESYQVADPLGNVFQQQFVTAVPPVVYYDVTVYEKFLQSIAIDRTGKSPQRIEDINYQPKGVGYFVIPPGDLFPGGDLDVFRSAKRANNPGAVRPLDPKTFSEAEPKDDPLKRALRELSDR